jgi:hypothetical protein
MPCTSIILDTRRSAFIGGEREPACGCDSLYTQKDEAVARYALEGLANKVLAREYMTALPSEKLSARGPVETLILI